MSEYKDMSKVRNPVAYWMKSSDAMTTRRFIQIVCYFPDLDADLARLLNLFATEMPKTYGGYASHRQ